MMHRNRSKDSQRKSSPPGPTYMSNDQIGKHFSLPFENPVHRSPADLNQQTI